MEKQKMSFSDKVKINAIKPFLPMVKESADKLLSDLLEAAERRLNADNGEVQVCMEVAKIEGVNYVLTVALNAENKIVRVIEQKTVGEVADTLTNIIAKL
ncbi:MAG: hypothetical protein PHH23_01865 [Paludibacteraceae bacterium]|nr:hypothetical protein [Paludibacteraceae bacterium]